VGHRYSQLKYAQHIFAPPAALEASYSNFVCPSLLYEEERCPAVRPVGRPPLKNLRNGFRLNREHGWFAERWLDGSPELLLDQLPLHRVARDGQLVIFGHGGF